MDDWDRQDQSSGRDGETGLFLLPEGKPAQSYKVVKSLFCFANIKLCLTLSSCRNMLCFKFTDCSLSTLLALYGSQGNRITWQPLVPFLFSAHKLLFSLTY